MSAGDTLRVGGKHRSVLVPPFGKIAPLHALAVIGKIWVGVTIALEQRRPLCPQVFPAGAELAGEMFVRAVRPQKFRVLGPALGAFGQLDLPLPQRFAVGAGSVLLVWGTVADMARDDDQARPIVDTLGDGDRLGDTLAIVGVADPLHMPAIGEKPPGDILGEGEGGITF